MIIETDRLILRPFQLKDLSHLHLYRNDPLCARYQAWENTTIEELKFFIKENMTRSLDDQQIQIALAAKETDQLIGDIFIAKKGHTITLGFTTSPPHQRKGYMLEALTAFIPYLQKRFPSSEIICLVHPGNHASEQLLKNFTLSKKNTSNRSIAMSLSLKSKRQIKRIADPIIRSTILF